jgi:hypothetical protein
MSAASAHAATSSPADADLRYPVGRYEAPAQIDAAQRSRWIDEIAALPAQLRAAVANLDEQQLDTPYRPGGWTARQVVHHVADSHMNALTRFKLALTEDTPTIKPYEESLWAELADARGPIATSLTLLDALHERWVRLLRGMDDGTWSRAFVHPEHNRRQALDWTLGMYVWHGHHHTAHVTSLRKRMGW